MIPWPYHIWSILYLALTHKPNKRGGLIFLSLLPSNNFKDRLALGRVGEWYTDKKENQIFLLYKEIQNRAVAKSYEEELPNVWGNAQIFHHIWGLSRPLVIYDFATAPFWVSYIWGKFDFLFYQWGRCMRLCKAVCRACYVQWKATVCTMFLLFVFVLYCRIGYDFLNCL